MILEANLKAKINNDMFLNTTKNKISEALFKVGSAIVEDAIIRFPRPPILTGTLRASYSIEVNGKLLEKGEGTSENLIEFARKENLLRVSFNTPYAARWHEKPFQPGLVSQQDGQVGNKYLSRKIETYYNDYLRILQRELKL